jgi:hypothetical protein
VPQLGLVSILVEAPPRPVRHRAIHVQFVQLVACHGRGTMVHLAAVAAVFAFAPRNQMQVRDVVAQRQRIEEGVSRARGKDGQRRRADCHALCGQRVLKLPREEISWPVGPLPGARAFEG